MGLRRARRRAPRVPAPTGRKSAFQAVRGVPHRGVARFAALSGRDAGRRPALRAGYIADPLSPPRAAPGEGPSAACVSRIASAIRRPPGGRVGGGSTGWNGVGNMKSQAGYPLEIPAVPGGKQHGARERGRGDQGVGEPESRLPANLARPLGDLPVDGDFAQRSQQGGRFPDSARSGEQLRSRYDRVVQSMAVRPQRAGATQVVDEHVRVHQNVSHVPIRRGWGRPRPAPRRT